MPQPLSRVTRTTQISLGSPDHLDKQPELALCAMKIIASASSIESNFAMMFVSLMGAEPRPAVAVYNSLRAESAKREALRAAAAAVLSEKNVALFEAILAYAKSAMKLRHKLAHWLWGFSPDVKDALLICDPVEMIEISMRGLDFSQQIAAGTIPSALPRIPHEKVLVVTLDELVQALSQMERTRRFVCDFEKVVAHSLETPPDNAADIVERLCSEPEIARELAKSRSK